MYFKAARHDATDEINCGDTLCARHHNKESAYEGCPNMVLFFGVNGPKFMKFWNVVGDPL